MGYDRADYAGKPVIAIINTWSDINPCHSHFKQRVEEVKRGVWQAGGFPVELPAMTLSEVFQKPTTMLYRNFLAMETEEVLRSYPADGAVLMGGCDKTTPALIMGATSVNLPAIYLPAGPMLRGDWRGETARLRVRRLEVLGRTARRQHHRGRLVRDRAGHRALAGPLHDDGHGVDDDERRRGAGPDAAGRRVDSGRRLAPRRDGRRYRAAHRRDGVGGSEAVDDLLTPAAFRNAVTTVLAIGGSTNAIIHLIAMARRAGVPLDLDDFDAIARTTPLLANIRPSGEYLMEDFYYAGGLRALLEQPRRSDRRRRALTVNGRTLGENIADAKMFNADVIRTPEHALVARDTLAVLRGNLAPDGAVIKPPAADPRLHRHAGRAVVFADYNDLAARIDDPDLPVDANSVLVLKHAGPIGAPGMPEWGQLPIPKKLLGEGVRDMVRISDARMSGTSYGACVLHVAPESHVGGPLALVQDGDVIELDVPARRLTLHVERRGARAPARGLAAAGAAVPARLRRAERAAHDAGQRRLRFRFPGGAARRRPIPRFTEART